MKNLLILNKNGFWRKYFCVFTLAFFVFGFLFLVLAPAQAQVLDQGLGEFGATAGYGEESLPQVVGRIVRIALSLLGLMAVIIMIIGGFVWMTSGGVPEKIDKAKKIIVSGLIGLLIIISAYAIVSFVMSKLGWVTGPLGPGPGGCTPGGCCASGWRCSVDGSCSVPDAICSSPFDQFRITKIETTHGGGQENYHQDVYLCSGLQPIFNAGVDGEKIQDLAGSNELKIESEICLGGTEDGKKCNPPAGGGGVTTDECQAGGGGCTATILNGDWHTRNNAVIFKHPELFNTYTSYSSYFPREILDRSGRRLQDCLAAGGCEETASYFIWNFATGETMDTISPEIVSTSPIFNPADEDYPDRNVSRKPNIRVNFSEPVDSITIMNEVKIDDEYYDYPIPENIWLAELDKQGGAIIETLSDKLWEITMDEYDDNGFRLKLRDDNLLKPFTWYRIHLGNIEDLCLNKMAEPVEWEFQTNDRAPGVSSWNPKGDRECPDTDVSVVFNTNMYDYKVKMTVSGGGNNFIFDLRPSDIGEPYIKEIRNGPTKIGVFQVLDPGEGSNNFRVFSFNPENNLQDNTKYSISVDTDLVIDRIGTRLSHQWNFTTSTLEDCLCAPWISSIGPDQGGKGECVTINGSCFTGTYFQPAVPSKLEFFLGETPTAADIKGYARNYLTTIIPSIFSKGDRPQAQVTITYDKTGDELVSDLPNLSAEFFVNSNKAATGPCLFSLDPNVGSPEKTLVDLTGIRFVGIGTESNQVKFYSEKVANYSSWTETKIKDALVPEGTQTGNVVVINDIGTSNGVSFTVREYDLPIIDSIVPDQGTNDPLIPTYVTIRGRNFGSYQDSMFVKFGDVQAEIGCNNWSNNEIVAIVPPKLSMDSDYSVSVVHSETGSSNEVTFKVRNKFNPALCQLIPNYGQKGDKISLSGANFGDLQGNSYIEFGSQNIDEIDEKSWSNNKINIAVPEVPESEPKVMVYVPSPIENGNPLKPSNPVTFYKPPIIESVSPESGPRKTWVTIRGQNFGSVPGDVYFRFGKVDYLAEDLPAYCGPTWTESQIIIEVPENLPLVPENTDNYQTQIYVKTAANIESNLFKWQVNKTPLAPALCLIEPKEEYPGFSPVTIMGTRFDLGPDALERQLIFNQNQPTQVLTWANDGEINTITVPAETISGDVVVKKKVTVDCRRVCDGFLFAGHCFGNWIEVCDQGWVVSNPLFFKSLAEEEEPEGPVKLPRVIEDSSCLINNQSPSPWPNFSNTCSNVGIFARFDKKIMSLRLVSSNIIIEKCNSGNESFNSNSCAVIEGEISLVNRDFGPPDTALGFIFTPADFLNQNYWYQVTLKSGEAGMRDVNDYQLDGNKNGREDGSPKDDYQWHFKTRDSAQVCSAEKVLVNEFFPEGEIPGLLVYTGTEKRDYEATAIGSDCQILVGGVSWNWSSSNPFAAVAIQKIIPSQAAASAQGLGETKIQATAISPDKTETTGYLDLIVATKPAVIETEPKENQTGVCRNALINIVFNQEMNSQSINQQTIELSKDNGQKIETEISRFLNGDNQTQVWLRLKQALEASQKYLVKIKASYFPAGETENSGVKSRYNVFLDGDIEWIFTTGEEVCQLSKVEITATKSSLSNPETTDITPPNSVVFYQSGNTVDFVSEAKDKNGDNIVEIAGLYDWDWSWNSSDKTVAAITNSVSSSELVTAKNKNGASNIVATATVTVDGVNQPRTVGNKYSNQGLVQVFVCENPWQYQDIKTHFMLFYCRDAEPLLPELPNVGFLQSPSNLQAAAVALDQIEFFWIDSSYNEDEFIIERGVEEEVPPMSSKDFYIAVMPKIITWTEIARVEENITSYSDTGLDSGVKYFYRVKACHSFGCSEWSRIVSAATFTCVPGDIETKECSIINGAGLQIKICSVSGSWGGWNICFVSSCDSGFHQKGNQCVADVAAGLRIFVTNGEWPGSLGGLSGADAKCQFDINNPDSGKAWKALVGTSQRQRIGSAWILLPNANYYRSEGSILIDTTDSNAWFTFDLDNAINPLNLKAWTGLDANGFYYPGYSCVGWTNPTAGPSGEYGTVFYKNSTAISHNTSYCTTHYHLYCVEQPPLPSPPSDAFVFAVSSKRIDLIWADNSNNETKFIIQRNGVEIATLGINSVSYSNLGLKPNTVYSYRVKACNPGGCSNWSNETSATTPAGPPGPPPYYYYYYY